MDSLRRTSCLDVLTTGDSVRILVTYRSRLLSSSDERTSLAALVFLLNALIGHHERFRDLFDTEAGGQIMDVVIHMYSPSRMDDYSDVIDIILAIADGFFEAGLAGALYAKMGPLDDVTTSQITWIHILASCQHELVHKDVARPWKTTAEPLVESMLLLTEQAIAEMNKAVTKSGEVNQSILVRSYLGLLGLLDCLHASGMRGQEAVGTKTQTDTEAVALLAHMRTAGVVPACVRLLHETNLYKPPVSPFQPALAGLQPPEGHVLSSLHTTQSEREIYADSSMPHLKRATLQLLGTLVFHPERTSTLPPHIKAVQDEVRELGGLYDVLSLTALDELNPCTYIQRAHTQIFASMLSLHYVTYWKRTTSPRPKFVSYAPCHFEGDLHRIWMHVNSGGLALGSPVGKIIGRDKHTSNAYIVRPLANKSRVA